MCWCSSVNCEGSTRKRLECRSDLAGVVEVVHPGKARPNREMGSIRKWNDPTKPEAKFATCKQCRLGIVTESKPWRTGCGVFAVGRYDDGL